MKEVGFHETVKILGESAMHGKELLTKLEKPEHDSLDHYNKIIRHVSRTKVCCSVLEKLIEERISELLGRPKYEEYSEETQLPTLDQLMQEDSDENEYRKY